MRRRRLLAAAAGTLGLAGCLSGAGESSDPKTDAPPTGATPPSGPTRTPKTTDSPVRRTADGVAATFRLVDSYGPTGDEELGAGATFEGDRVVVTGCLDPAGCRRPTLRSVGWDASTRTVRLVVATESPYGPTADVDCGNAVYEYRCVATVDGGSPAVVEVVHALADREDRTFVLESG